MPSSRSFSIWSKTGSFGSKSPKEFFPDLCRWGELQGKRSIAMASQMCPRQLMLDQVRVFAIDLDTCFALCQMLRQFLIFVRSQLSGGGKRTQQTEMFMVGHGQHLPQLRFLNAAVGLRVGLYAVFRVHGSNGASRHRTTHPFSPQPRAS